MRLVMIITILIFGSGAVYAQAPKRAAKPATPVPAKADPVPTKVLEELKKSVLEAAEMAEQRRTDCLELTLDNLGKETCNRDAASEVDRLLERTIVAWRELVRKLPRGEEIYKLFSDAQMFWTEYRLMYCDVISATKAEGVAPGTLYQSCWYWTARYRVREIVQMTAF